MQRIAAFARERRIGLHLDGARLFLAAPYTGIAPQTYAALVRYRLRVVVQIFQCRRRCSARRSAAICSTTSTISAACSAAGCGRPGLTRQSPCIISMASKSVSGALRRRLTIIPRRRGASKLLRYLRWRRRYERHPAAGLRWRCCASPGTVARIQECDPASNLRCGGGGRIRAESPTRRSCGAPWRRRSRLSSRRSKRCDRDSDASAIVNSSLDDRNQQWHPDSGPRCGTVRSIAATSDSIRGRCSPVLRQTRWSFSS